MYSKHKRPYESESLAPNKRLRSNLQDIFSSNQLSGKRTQELINDIADAGNEELEALRGRVGGHSSRKLKSAFLKRNQWPSLYWARIRVLNVRTAVEEYQQCAFILPHEYLGVLAKLGTMDMLLDKSGLDPVSRAHLDQCERRAGEALIPVGLWGDGVPVNWDRTESVETVSLNLPGQAGAHKDLRLPVTGVPHKQFGEHTWDDIMEVVAWSLNHAAANTRPNCRHDNTAWLATDTKRRKLAETSLVLGARAALVEVRGDWKMFGEVFRFPKHNTKAGCCWLCTCTPEQVDHVFTVFITFVPLISRLLLRRLEITIQQIPVAWIDPLEVREYGSGAGWRAQRLSHWDVLHRILQSGQRVSPLLQVVWVDICIFRIDWLHAVDQGVAADYLGNLFRLISSKLPGRSLKVRTAALWVRIQAGYTANNTADRLQNLVPTMIKQDKKAPKLRWSAAQCRALIPISNTLASQLLNDADPVECAAKAGMHHLHQCYMALSHGSIFAADVLREHSTKFAAQYVALEAFAADPHSWKVKPKLLLFLELCSDGSRPAMFWNYRDEDFGGSVAHLSRRRGGCLSVKAFSGNMLDRFKIKQPVVRMI